MGFLDEFPPTHARSRHHKHHDKRKKKFIEGLTLRIEKVLIQEERAITDKGIKSTIVRVYTLKPNKNHLIATQLFEEK